MQIKNLTEDELNDIASTVDNQGFWYALAYGGYLKPHEILDNEDDADAILAAVALLREFDLMLPQL